MNVVEETLKCECDYFRRNVIAKVAKGSDKIAGEERRKKKKWGKRVSVGL